MWAAAVIKRLLAGRMIAAIRPTARGVQNKSEDFGQIGAPDGVNRLAPDFQIHKLLKGVCNPPLLLGQKVQAALSAILSIFS